MASATLMIDLDAIAANWRALDRLSANGTQTAAVVKADAYGLGAGRVVRALAEAGARRFFVALAQEAVVLRQALGPGPQISVLAGHMAGDSALIHDLDLTPMLNSVDQITRHFESLPGHPFGIQLDTGMNRLGLEAAEWAAVAGHVLAATPELVMSHLACGDDPGHPLNADQLAQFHYLTDGIAVPRSLAATAGIVLGPEYHFDLTRPGIGLYGGLPFDHARPVVTLDLPVIQVRDLQAGEVAGYGNTWQAERPSRLATVSAGYADGILRSASHKLKLWHGDTPVPAVGRVSMDLIIADVTDLPEEPSSLALLGPHQTVDQLAEAAGTIGYEVLTSLGPRYARSHVE